MTLHSLYEITAVALACLSLYMLLIHISTPALRGVRWVAIAYGTGALGIALRVTIPGRLPILLGNLLIAFLLVAFYWGLAQLLHPNHQKPDQRQERQNHLEHQERPDLRLLVFLLPILISQVYFLYFNPWVEPRSITLDAVQALLGLAITTLLLRRGGTAHARMPSLLLALFFFCWFVSEAVIATRVSLAVHSSVLKFSQILSPAMVLYAILPIALMCQGFLWLSMATLQNDLEHQSRTDVLTGLLNRRALRDVALREIGSARRRNQPLAVILLDLDHFKSINDRHGHDGGDSALCLTAACLVANLRPIDRIARLGGEEFVALLPEADDRQGVLVAERIRSHIERLSTEHPGTCAPLSASFGITCLQPADTTPEELLKRADQALYAAKNNGRNRVSVL